MKSNEIKWDQIPKDTHTHTRLLMRLHIQIELVINFTFKEDENLSMISYHLCKEDSHDYFHLSNCLLNWYIPRDIYACTTGTLYQVYCIRYIVSRRLYNFFD